MEMVEAVKDETQHDINFSHEEARGGCPGEMREVILCSCGFKIHGTGKLVMADILKLLHGHSGSWTWARRKEGRENG